MDMKIDAEAIEKSINAIPGVCEDGKKAIKKIFEDGFGVKFKFKEKIDLGREGLVFDFEGSHFVVSSDNCSKGVFRIDKQFRIDTSDFSFWKDMNKNGRLTIVANSPEEYFRKKFAGEL